MLYQVAHNKKVCGSVVPNQSGRGVACSGCATAKWHHTSDWGSKTYKELYIKRIGSVDTKQSPQSVIRLARMSDEVREGSEGLVVQEEEEGSTEELREEKGTCTLQEASTYRR